MAWLRATALALVAAAALAACPNQCSGHGRCSTYDKCVCFTQQGLYSPTRPGFTGADCSLRTCPLGKAFDYLSSESPFPRPSPSRRACPPAAAPPRPRGARARAARCRPTPSPRSAASATLPLPPRRAPLSPRLTSSAPLLPRPPPPRAASIPALNTQVFNPVAGAQSVSKLQAVFIPAAQAAGFKALRRDQLFWVEIMSVAGDNVTGPQPPYGTFTWRFDEDEYFQPENDVSATCPPPSLRTASPPTPEALPRAQRQGRPFLRHPRSLAISYSASPPLPLRHRLPAHRARPAATCSSRPSPSDNRSPTTSRASSPSRCPRRTTCPRACTSTGTR